MKMKLLTKTKIYSKIFLFFILAFIFVFSFTNTKAVEEKGCKNGKTTCIQDCGWSISGQCVVTKKEIEDDGKKITRIMEIPMGDYEIQEGRVTDKYTDNEGKTHYRTGTANTDEKITHINNWETESEYENIISGSDTIDDSIYTGKKTKTTTFFGYTLLQPLPTSGKDLDKNVTLSEYMAWLYRFALVLAGFLAVMMIVIGGVTYIASGANEGLKTKAKGYINGALQGLLLAIAAYLLLYTINPSLVTTTPDSVFKEFPITGAGGSEDVEKTGSKNDGGIDIFFPGNEGSSGTVKDFVQDTYQKQDGGYSYSVKRTKETIEYEDGLVRYRTLERYTDNNKDNHYVVTIKDEQGSDIFSGESVEYFDNDGNYEEIKFFKNGKEIEQSKFILYE